MRQRLQKILSRYGLASRRESERLIAQGRVTVNGVIAAVGDGADPACDAICLDGVQLTLEPELCYLMLNKPRGFVTTLHDEHGRRNVAQLLADCGARVYPVGRLDMDSEGLLLFTNDGALAHALMHPRHEAEKVYRVTVTGYREEALELLRRPLMLDGYRIRPPKVRLLSGQGDRAELEVTIHEGRNRQIRRMCDAAGLRVTRLRRVAECGLQLGDLPPGSWRPLTDDELAVLRQKLGLQT